MAEIVVTDESETRPTICYVMDEKGNVTKVEKSFVAKKAGVYTVYYYVYDANNNVTIVSYEITIS